MKLNLLLHLIEYIYISLFSLFQNLEQNVWVEPHDKIYSWKSSIMKSWEFLNNLFTFNQGFHEKIKGNETFCLRLFVFPTPSLSMMHFCQIFNTFDTNVSSELRFIHEREIGRFLSWWNQRIYLIIQGSSARQTRSLKIHPNETFKCFGEKIWSSPKIIIPLQGINKSNSQNCH